MLLERPIAGLWWPHGHISSSQLGPAVVEIHLPVLQPHAADGDVGESVATESVQGKVVLSPAQHSPRLPSRDRPEGGDDRSAGGRERRKREGRLRIGRSDGGQGGPADSDGIGSRAPRGLHDLSRTRIEQGDRQMPGIHGPTQAVRGQPGRRVSRARRRS
jgi:hypothetical protein